ncbi:MAG: hypothetical protein AB1757_06770 [Acidobacteriota bacterium]
MTQEDHDLLIELRTEVKGMRVDIRDLKDGTTERLTDVERDVDELEKNKASKVDLAQTDRRLDRVRTTQNLMIGGLIVINVLLPFIIKYLFG